KLDFPVELLRDRLVVLDGFVGPDDAGRRLREDDGLLGQILCRVEGAGRFRDVLDIIETDAKNVLPRTRDRRQQPDIHQRKCDAYRPVILALVQYLLEGRQRGRPEIDEIEHW